MQTVLAIVELLRLLFSLGEKLAKAASDGKTIAWVRDLESSVDQLEKAKSLEEKVNAAKRLSDLVARMGR